jgi:hypothetical protein
MKTKLLGLAVLLFLSAGFLYSQERRISGKVTSGDDGSALPGVNVLLKGNAGHRHGCAGKLFDYCAGQRRNTCLFVCRIADSRSRYFDQQSNKCDYANRCKAIK